MKILSWNVNGIRSVYKHGFLRWLKEADADIVCLQEIKAKENQLPEELLKPTGYETYFNAAVKPGYSGVAVYTKKKPLRIEKALGLTRFDQEGRILKLDFPEFSLVNVYLPHGGRQKENLNYKLQVYAELLKSLSLMQNKRVIVVGDFNIAHQDIDLARPRQNRDNIMFTPEERRQIDKLLALGFVDSFRQFHPDGGNYTWWSYGLQARERNLGWRIDYAFVSRKLGSNLMNAFIAAEVEGSDHCPIGIESRWREVGRLAK